MLSVVQEVRAGAEQGSQRAGEEGGLEDLEGLHSPSPPPPPRWLVVKDSFLLYMRLETGTISFVQLFDPGFEVQVGKRRTEARYGVRIDTSHR